MATARAHATGINGRPVAISPRMNYQTQESGIGGDGGFLSSLLCGGGDSNFLLCDGGGNNEVDFDINPTGVYVAVHTKQWNLAIERVKVYPREASTWVVRYGTPQTAADSSEVPVRSLSDGGGAGAAMAVATSPRGAKVLRWRMLPLHASLLFNAPIEVLQTLIKVYPAAVSSHDDQGMLPLHLAFRAGSPENIVLLLLDAYPEAIERVDYKGRLPSTLAPKDALSYGDTLAESFVRGPSHYYWSARVATADRLRSERAMTAKIKQLEESARVNNERGKETLENTQMQLSEEIELLSIENVELKQRLVWYETKYDGAEEKEKILVDHTNSLAERLRLTSLSEEHLATKLAKLETRLQNKETELDRARLTATDEKESLESRVAELEQSLASTKHCGETLTENLEKKVLESTEMKVRFEKERQLFEKQIDASKECLMELIAGSKEDKRMFEQDSRELRRQLADIQTEVQKASVTEKRMFEEDSQSLRKQLMAIQKEVQKANEARSVPPPLAPASPVALPRELEDRLDTLQRELTNNTRSFMSRVEIMEAEEQQQRDYAIQRQKSSAEKIEGRLDNLQKEVMSRVEIMESGEQQQRDYAIQRQRSSAEKIEDRLDSLQKEVGNARSLMNRGYAANIDEDPTMAPERPSRNLSKKSAQQPKKVAHQRVKMPELQEDEEALFDTYVSTKSTRSDQTRDDSESGKFSHATHETVFSHESDVDTAMALGELTEEQRLALESLDLGGTREEISAMLGKVPGLTKNQVNLLVDVASSLAA